jgi:5-dehydro-2-deoxygluconokinase
MVWGAPRGFCDVAHGGEETTTMADIDLLTIGRANMDLYSRDIGAPFADATSFDAMVGGSPTNIAIGVSRLGLASAVLTAVGDDPTGDFVLRYLADEGVNTSFIQRIGGKLTSLALLGVQPPDTFPLTFYREDPADIHLTVGDVDRVGMSEVRSVEISGNALSRGTCADATRHLIDLAASSGAIIYMDVDLRPSEWQRLEDFGTAIRSVLGKIDVLMGTEEELSTIARPDPGMALPGARIRSDAMAHLDDAVGSFLDQGAGVVITKRGARGASITGRDMHEDVQGFDVDVLNTVGAGDAFAAGLIRSRLLGLEWDESVRFANACGAIVVTRHGCSSAFPTEDEVCAFLAERGSPCP